MSIRKDFRIHRNTSRMVFYFHIGKMQEGQDLTPREGAGGVRTRQTWWRERLGRWRGIHQGCQTLYGNFIWNPHMSKNASSFLKPPLLFAFDFKSRSSTARWWIHTVHVTSHNSVHKVSSHKRGFLTFSMSVNKDAPWIVLALYSKYATRNRIVNVQNGWLCVSLLCPIRGRIKIKCWQ